MNRGALTARAWYDRQRAKSGGKYRLLDWADALGASPEQLSNWLAGRIVPLIKARVKFQKMCAVPLLDWDVAVFARTEWRTESGELVLASDKPSAGAA